MLGLRGFFYKVFKGEEGVRGIDVFIVLGNNRFVFDLEICLFLEYKYRC